MSASVRQSSAQSYLQQNRIGALFEELMAALIRDQPQEPLAHLMRCLQRKASDRGIAIPVALRASDDQLAATSPVPRPSTAAPSVKTTPTVAGGASGGRSYEKPWLSRASAASTTGGPMRKSNSGEPMVDYDDNPLARGSSQQHRQPSRASIASTGGEAVFLWSSAGPAGSPAVVPAATAAAIAEAEADILGSEFRLAKGPAPATASSASASSEAGTISRSVAGGPRKPTAGARLAAKDARRRQLDALIADKNNNNSSEASRRCGSTDGVKKDRLEDDDDAEPDGVFLLEDAEALAAEGARVTRRGGGGGGGSHGVATSRQRDALGAAAAVSAPVSAEPQVRMTFCGRCFVIINEGEEAGGVDLPTAAPARDSAVHRGGGFGAGGVDLADPVEFDQYGPQTGRTNATMTEVTDIESASQVTGPRRPSWTASSKQQPRLQKAATGGGGRSTRLLDDPETPASASRAPVSQASRQQQSAGGGFNSGDFTSFGGGGSGSGKGWGAAAAAAAAAGDDSDPETATSAAPGDRFMQQDNRLY